MGQNGLPAKASMESHADDRGLGKQNPAKTAPTETGKWDPAVAPVVRLVEGSSAPMALMMGPRGILHANKEARRLFVGQTGELNGRSVLDVLPSIAPFYASVLKQGLEGKSLEYAQQAVKLKLDKERAHWFNLSFTPVLDQTGKIAGVLGIASDVTALMDQIRELSESEQRLRLALEESGMVGIWAHDVTTGRSTADANVARIYGLPKEAAVEGLSGAQFIKAIHPDDQKHAAKLIAESIATGRP